MHTTMAEEIGLARTLLEAVMADPEAECLQPQVGFLRAGKRMAACVAGDHATALKAASIGCAGFSAEELVLVLDARMQGPISPDEGLPLPGELALRQEMGDPTVTDVLIVVHAVRDGGPATAVFMPYHLSGREIVWDTEHPIEMPPGYVIGMAAVHAINLPTLSVRAQNAQEIFGLSNEEAQLRADGVTAGLIAKAGVPVMMIDDDGEHLERVQEVARRTGAMTGPLPGLIDFDA